MVYKASGALTSKGHVSFGVGLGYQFDKNDRVNDTERNKISEFENMVKVLQEKESKHISKEAETQELINRLLQRIENLENKK